MHQHQSEIKYSAQWGCIKSKHKKIAGKPDREHCYFLSPELQKKRKLKKKRPTYLMLNITFHLKSLQQKKTLMSPVSYSSKLYLAL